MGCKATVGLHRVGYVLVRQREGWVMTTSANKVLKSLSVTTRSILPFVIFNPGAGGAISNITVSMLTASLADLVMAAIDGLDFPSQCFELFYDFFTVHFLY